MIKRLSNKNINLLFSFKSDEERHKNFITDNYNGFSLKLLNFNEKISRNFIEIYLQKYNKVKKKFN